MNAIESVRQTVRTAAKVVARGLDKASNHKITPNSITALSLLGHFIVFYALALGSWYWGAGLLIVFGLMDALDGELARLQGSASSIGMVLDASSDRLKEGLVYAGLVYYFAGNKEAVLAAAAVGVMALSYSTSYIKAKGEAALSSSQNVPAEQINRVFISGLMRYEIRMAVLVIGMLAGYVEVAIWVLLALTLPTALWRLINVKSALR